jgi:hypothetical protein
MVEEITTNLTPTEQAFGDFRQGRYAWQLEITHRFQGELPAVAGRQSIFEKGKGKGTVAEPVTPIRLNTAGVSSAQSRRQFLNLCMSCSRG